MGQKTDKLASTIEIKKYYINIIHPKIYGEFQILAELNAERLRKFVLSLPKFKSAVHDGYDVWMNQQVYGGEIFVPLIS